jgi:flavin reductase (DIM6/NTAB) family NADH-FMN oxidoreductase RutF
MSDALTSAAADTLEIRPKILYFGTPVVLLTTLNEDGSPNLAPMSSAWALGSHLVLGLGLGGQSWRNLAERGECVVNLPSADLWRRVEALAPLTAASPVPAEKEAQGFRHERRKFEAAGLTASPATRVRPPRVAECPLQIEAIVRRLDTITDAAVPFGVAVVEAVAVHAHRQVVRDRDHVDPATWRPLIYNFRHYYGLGAELGKTFRAET